MTFHRGSGASWSRIDFSEFSGFIHMYNKYISLMPAAFVATKDDRSPIRRIGRANLRREV